MKTSHMIQVFLRTYHLVLLLLMYNYAFLKKSCRKNLLQYCREKYPAISVEYSILMQLNYVCFPLR